MIRFALLAFAALEAVVLVLVAQQIGVVWLLVLLLVLGVLGLLVTKRGGVASLRELSDASSEARLPDGSRVVDHLAVVLAGALIAVPGLISSAVGLLLLVPPVRRLATRPLGRWLDSRTASVALVMPGTRDRVVRGTVISSEGPASTAGTAATRPEGPAGPPPALPG